MAETPFPESWRAALDPVLATPRLRALDNFLTAEEAAGKTIYPPRNLRFAALEHTPLDAVKVVILGQDPYHGPGQAHDFDRIERGVFERGEAEVARGVDGFACGLLGGEEACQRAEAGGLQHRLKRRSPAFGEGGFRHFLICNPYRTLSSPPPACGRG